MATHTSAFEQRPDLFFKIKGRGRARAVCSGPLPRPPPMARQRKDRQTRAEWSWKDSLGPNRKCSCETDQLSMAFPRSRPKTSRVRRNHSRIVQARLAGPQGPCGECHNPRQKVILSGSAGAVKRPAQSRRAESARQRARGHVGAATPRIFGQTRHANSTGLSTEAAVYGTSGGR